ncbi:MAG: GNAT family N-acetyltransferase [Pseudomonadota bacterium]|nr:GNAT family N-acetyltransferase [Pseudomonadota bacterium]
MAIITPAQSASETAVIAELARLIWNAHYNSIISQQQIDYMLDKFQSSTAINQQIADGTLYFLISSNSQPVGYLALMPDAKNDKLHISKIYIDAANRGQGHGKQALDFIEQQCRDIHIHTLWLTVNKHNHIAINAYRRWGFHTTGSIVTDIGNEFVMDDYVMEKSIHT